MVNFAFVKDVQVGFANIKTNKNGKFCLKILLC